MKEPKPATGESAPVVMIPVQLLKHYRPTTMNFVIVKDVPPPLAGVAADYKDKDGAIVGRKLWAGTVVELPSEEARKLLFHVTTTFEPLPGPDGKPMRNREGDIVRREVKIEFPLAKRMDPLPDVRAA